MDLPADPELAASSSAAGFVDQVQGHEEEEEENCCRVCCGPETEREPLFFPCKCKGSIKFVHQNCLERWLRTRGARNCELCGFAFQFEPVLAEDAPEPGIAESAKLILHGICQIYPKLARIAVAILLWLYGVPLISLWMLETAFWMKFPYLGRYIYAYAGKENSRSLLIDAHLGALIILAALVAAFIFIFIRELILIHEEQVIRRENVDAVAQDQAMHVVGQDMNLGQNIRQGEFPAEPRIIEEHGDDPVDGEPFGILDWAGIKGPISRLLLHVIISSSFLALVILLFVFLPMLTSEVALGMVGKTPKEFSLYLIFETKHFLRFLVMMLSKDVLAIKKSSTSLFSQLLFDHDLVELQLHPIHSRFIQLGFGYFLCAQFSIIWTGLCCLLGHKPFYIRKIQSLVQLLCTSLKLGIILSIELLLCPVFFGFVIDILTIHLRDSSVSLRLNSIANFPLLNFIIYWIVGFSVMYSIATFASYLRKVVRSEVLDKFLRDPDDPNFNAIQEIIEQPLRRISYRFIVTILIYIGLLFIGVYLPLQLFFKAFPTIFPLKIFIANAFEIPCQILMYNVFVPKLFDILYVNQAFLVLLKAWFSFFGHILGLKGYLLISGNPERINHELTHFPIRIFALLFSMWLTHILATLLWFLIPLIIGRFMFSFFLANLADTSAFIVGLSICSFLFGSAQFIFTLDTHGIFIRWLNNILHMVYGWTKRAVIVCIIRVLIPFLIGLIVDLCIIMPFLTSDYVIPVASVNRVRDFPCSNQFFCLIYKFGFV